MRKITALIFSVIGIVIFIVFPQAVTQGISEGMKNSARLLIPSLFPFMVVSSFIIRSGAYESTEKFLSPLTKLLKLPTCASFAVILSMIGGFPVGAKCIRLLYEKKCITPTQAERMSYFCVCSGPAFLMTAVGTLLLHSTIAGIILYLTQILSVILLGIITRFLCKDDLKFSSLSRTEQSPDLIQTFILSCSDGANAIIELTALVAIFSMGISVISSLHLDNPVISLFLEVTSACKSLTDTGFSLSWLAFATGFGGLCVHFQIFSIFKDINIHKLRFELFRLLNAIISCSLTSLICLFVHPSVQTFAISENTKVEITSNSLIGSVSLVFMSSIFLLSLKNGSIKKHII